jgi:hypothetical protein
MGLIFGRSVIAKTMWQNAKKTFEEKTGKKKPSEKFLGAFRKSSGVESALDNLDQLALKVWDAKTQKDFDAAKKKFLEGADKLKKVSAEYVKLLQQAAEGAYAAHKTEVEELQKKLTDQVNGLINGMKNRNGFK